MAGSSNGPWKADKCRASWPLEDWIVRDVHGDKVAESGDCANVHLIQSAPIGYELAEMVLKHLMPLPEVDCCDPCKAIVAKARELKALADGRE